MLGIVANTSIINPIESSTRFLTLSEHVVLIGARGWIHEGWSGEFYPEDLPDEWQVGYYGNEFQVVMVPASYWSTQADKFDEWLEESDESLKMICEWPAQGATAAQISEAERGIEALAERVLAVLIKVETEVSEFDLAIYMELADKYPLCFEIKDDLATDKRRQLQAWLTEEFAGKDYGIVWTGEPALQSNLALGSVSVTKLSGEVDPKQLRTLFECILAAGTENRNQVLIVDGEPPSMQLLTNAGIILDLL